MGVCASSHEANERRSSLASKPGAPPSVVTHPIDDKFWVHHPLTMSVEEKCDMITHLQRTGLSLGVKKSGLVRSPSAKASAVKNGATTLKAQESIDGLTAKDRHNHVEEHIRDIFVHTFGAELSELKREIDLGSDKYDLLQLILKIKETKADVADDIVAHIHTESEKLAVEPGYKRGLVVLADVDDTFTMCAVPVIGKPMSGAGGQKYPRPCVVPGFLPLARALGEGRIVFISARPEILENKTLREFKTKYGLKNATLLTGNAAETLLMGITKTKSAIAAVGKTKLVNFNRYKELYPEKDFVWIGGEWPVFPVNINNQPTSSA